MTPVFLADRLDLDTTVVSTPDTPAGDSDALTPRLNPPVVGQSRWLSCAATRPARFGESEQE
jgi:hypothetical protein